MAEWAAKARRGSLPKTLMAPATSDSFSFGALARVLSKLGVERVLIKRLAPNDNSKNQIYLGSDLGVVNVIPSGVLTFEATRSTKRGAAHKQLLKASLRWGWVDVEGAIHEAPNAQLILYPQYPEVRLSGFLAGSTIELGQWFDPRKDGRRPGRVLILGIANSGMIYAHLALPGSVLDRELARRKSLRTFGALAEVEFIKADGEHQLLNELRRIHSAGWIIGKRLDAHRNVLPCNSSNCGGYTLEAELGIVPNGYSDPDFQGWEVKAFAVDNFGSIDAKVITLMTPEPDGGYYKRNGAAAFVREFGYADTRGCVDRFNFGGIHTFNNACSKTGLTLTLLHYDVAKNKILDVQGGIALVRGEECAALWTFQKLLEHWKRKHDRAAYVPYLADVRQLRRYRYGNEILCGRGADFTTLINAIVVGNVYYDPGIKLEAASSTSPKAKRRSQFRIKTRNLNSLYTSFGKVSL